MGTLTGFLLTRLVPRGQTRIPRHLVLALCILTGFLASLPAATQVGLARSGLALGDALSEGQRVVLIPFGGDLSLREGAQLTRRHLQEEASLLRENGLVRYSIQYVALAPIWEPIESFRALAKEYIEDPYRGNTRARIRSAWENARPTMGHMARRKTAGSVLFAGLTWGVQLLGGLLLILVSHKELSRVARAIEQYQD